MSILSNLSLVSFQRAEQQLKATLWLHHCLGNTCEAFLNGPGPCPRILHRVVTAGQLNCCAKWNLNICNRFQAYLPEWCIHVTDLHGLTASVSATNCTKPDLQGLSTTVSAHMMLTAMNTLLLTPVAIHRNDSNSWQSIGKPRQTS